MEHHDFHLRAWQPDQGAISVLVHSSPAGDMRVPETTKVDLARFRAVPELFASTPQGLWFLTVGKEQPVLDVAAAMGRALLPPRAAALLDRSLSCVPAGDGIRLRLCLDVPLIDVPWEFAYRPDVVEDGDVFRGFLVLNPRLSVVREAPRWMPAFPSSTSGERLGCVGTLWRTPTGLQDVWGSTKEFETVAKVLQPVTDRLRPEFSPTHDGGWERILSTSAAFFHYVGHTDQVDGDGYMVLKYPDVPGERVFARDLAVRLRAARTRLAVCSACNSGRWAFVGPLLAEGLPALIGTAGILSTFGAFAWSEKLYRALAAGLSLDEAVSWGRLHLLTACCAHEEFRGQRNFEWASFMVYLRSDRPILLPLVPGPAARQEQESVRVGRQETVTQYNFITQHAGSIAPGGSMTGVADMRGGGNGP